MSEVFGDTTTAQVAPVVPMPELPDSAASKLGSNPVQEPAPVVTIGDLQKVATEADGIEAQKDRENSAYARIVGLSERRARWQNTVFKDSNDMLYGVLQGCYNLYADLSGKSVEASALRGALALLLKQRNIEVRESTHTMTKIVRCVFDGDRRRISAYSRALRAALDKKVHAAKLAVFIYEAGGVEELRLGKPGNAMSPADKAEQVKEAIKAKNIGVFDAAAVSDQLDHAAVGNMRILIATQDASAKFTVNAVISSASAMNAALVAYYSANKDSLKSDGSAKAQSAKAVDEEALLEALAAEAASAQAA